MTDYDKINIIILILFVFGGLAFAVIFKWAYAIPLFDCFPLASIFIFHNKVYYRGWQISNITQFLAGLIFLGLGIYFILEFNRILP